MSFTKLQRIEAAWKTGQLFYKLRECQEIPYYQLWKVLDGTIKTNTYVVNCSRRFGKSFILVLIAIEFALRFPKSQIRYAIPIAANYADMLMPSINYILEDVPLDLNIVHLKSEKRITFGNDSMIKFAGTDNGNAENLRGNTSHLNILDEAGFMTDLNYVYEGILYPQTWTTNGKTLFSSTPPKTLDHDYVAIYREHAEKNLVSQYTIYDNTALDDEKRQEIIDEYGGETSTAFKREAMCMFVGEDELSIIPGWKDEYEQDWERGEYFKYYHKYSSLDTGVKDFTAGLFGYYDFENAKLIIEDEVIMSGPTMTTELLAKDLKFKINELQYDKFERMVADNNNLHLIQDLSITYQLFYSPVKKTDLDAMVNKVKIMVTQGKLIVSPKCKQLIGCLRYGVWKSKEYIGKEFGRSKIYSHYDALASLIYLSRVLNTTTNPIPFLTGVNIANTFVRRETVKPVSDSAKALQGAFSRRKNIIPVRRR